MAKVFSGSQQLNHSQTLLAALWKRQQQTPDPKTPLFFHVEMNGAWILTPSFSIAILAIDEHRLSTFRCIFRGIFRGFDGQELEHNPFLRASCENMSDEEMGKLRRGCLGCTLCSPSNMALKSQGTTLWWTYKKLWKITMLLMGKSTINGHFQLLC